MSLTINEPIKTINGLLTEAVAANTQLLYTMKREDTPVIAVGTLNTNASIKVTGDITGIYTVGDTIYVEVDSGLVPKGLYTILSINQLTNAYLEVGFPLQISETPDTGYVNNLTTHSNYRITIDVIDSDTHIKMFNTTFLYIPNQAGLLDIDLGGIITSFMKNAGKFSQQYYLTVYEVWDAGSAGSYGTLAVQAILAKKQLLSLGGANMWENLLVAESTVAIESVLSENGKVKIFIAAIEGDIRSDFTVGAYRLFNFDASYESKEYRIESLGWTGTNTTVFVNQDYISNSLGSVVKITNGEFLTKFKDPKKWLGWKRTVSALKDIEYSTRVGDTTGSFSFNEFDINKAGTGAPTVEVGITAVSETKIAVIPEPTTSTTSYMTVIVRDGTLANRLSERLNYKIEQECNNPIMLDWINSLGGIDQWLFENSQPVQIVSDSGIVAERTINTDIETITRTKQRFATTFRQQITLRARDLTTSQVLALQEIKQTESLRVYLSKDGTSFIDGIVIALFTTDYNRRDSTHSFMVVVELPDGFKFETGKLY